jgi:hypothetical protein
MNDVSLVKLDGLRQGKKVKAVKLTGYDSLEVFSVPSRGGDILDVKVSGESAMMINSRGHINGNEIDTFGLQLVNWVEGFTTCGPDNVGGPTAAYSGHGTFSHSPLLIEKATETEVTGVVSCVNLVLGPYIDVRRTVSVSQEERSYTVTDELMPGRIEGNRPYEGENDYMWLYHPNFPIQDGDRLFCNARCACARDLLCNCDIDQFATMSQVGKGKAVFPPTQPEGDNFGAVREENFERCYVMDMEPDAEGNVYAAMISADDSKGSYIRYNVNQFKKPMAFQFWRNPRGGTVGLEVGTTFMGRDYAMEHGLMGVLKAGETHTYEVEVGFLRGADEVKEFVEEQKIGVASPQLVKAVANDPDKGEYFHKAFYKMYQ